MTKKIISFILFFPRLTLFKVFNVSLLCLFSSFSNADAELKPGMLFDGVDINVGVEAGGYIASGPEDVSWVNARIHLDTTRGALFNRNIISTAYGKLSGQEIFRFDVRGYTNYALSDNWSITNNRRSRDTCQNSECSTDFTISLGGSYFSKDSTFDIQQYVGLGYQNLQYDAAPGRNELDEERFVLDLFNALDIYIEPDFFIEQTFNIEFNFVNVYWLYSVSPTYRVTDLVAVKTTLEYHFYSERPVNIEGSEVLTSFSVVVFF